MSRFSFLLILFLLSIAAYGKSLSVNEVPVPLQPWVDWVLYDNDEYRCPHHYNNIRQRYCSWPGSLELKLHDSGGSFSYRIEVYQKSRITLPGSDRHWPQQVTENGKLAVVLEENGLPQIELAAGRYRLQGEFYWDSLPKSLQISPNVGLVSLTVDQRQIRFPERDEHGKLWLQDRADRGQPDQEDKLEIRVFRKLIDEIPARLITRVQLDVTGSQREVVLGKALLQDFMPLRLSGQIPARLEQDGRLRVQVRPGTWFVELDARATVNQTHFSLPQLIDTWPDSEVWVFEAHNAIRLVEVEGHAIDPRQTTLPEPWQRYPAYLLQGGETLGLKVIRRGDPEPEPDQLFLQRSLWLDFDGRGYTIQDRITGSMTRGWRLEVVEGLELGRALLNGKPILITHLPDSKGRGVEVRRGEVNLLADSRLGESTRSIPATGWKQDFQRVSALLNLPPGWLLLTARGVDNVPQTWIQQWSLLDLFLVLILSLAIYRMWNWKWGLLALVSLTLIWHESWAPQLVWINILAAIALLRVIPAGRFALVVGWYRNLSLLALILIVIPFAVQQIRTGIYPQLERPWQQMGTMHAAQDKDIAVQQAVANRSRRLAEKPAAPEEQAPEPEAEYYSSPTEAMKFKLESSVEEKWAPELYRGGKVKVLDEIDPGAKLQTGPGVPDWRWKKVQLEWNGPVEPGQRVRLVLLPPVVNMLLNFLRVALVLVLVSLMLGINLKNGRLTIMPLFRFGGGVSLIGLSLLLQSWSDPLLAQQVNRAEAQQGFPPAEMLEQLRTRLLAAPDCLPQCAQSPRMSFELDQNRLQLRMQIHAAEKVAVPIPALAQQWYPEQVLLDGSQVSALFRDHQGQLWLALPAGQHQLILRGSLPVRNEISLPLLLRPHYASYQSQGWRVDGVHEDGQTDNQLKFTRLQQGEEGKLEALKPGTLPPFVRIERVLHLGLEWQVETRVIRASPQGVPVFLQVPLLEGESPVTDELRMEDRHVSVNLAADQSVFYWRSVLQKQNSLKLMAPDTLDWVEIWRVDVSPVWHMRSDGLAVVHHQDRQKNWLPEWRPWPGESVTLELTRPEAVAGQTKTIDHTAMQIEPGQRASHAELRFRLRSSQGGQHQISLPPEARLQQVKIDGTTQPIRQEGRQVTLPVKPGSQVYELTWRSPAAMQMRYRTAQVDLGQPGSNNSIQLGIGHDRWVLLTGGPQVGPAVLYWGILIVIALVAVGLGRVRLTPLRAWHWLLLGIGLSQVSLAMGMIVVVWLMALGLRGRMTNYPGEAWFNLMQAGLAILTVVALLFLFAAVQQGLLGTPEMHVAGNNSTAYQLNWYQDRSDGMLPVAWFVSVPLLVYRLLMLAWALWLAFYLLLWLRWGWRCYATGGIWRKLEITEKADAGDKAGSGEPQPKPDSED